MLLFSPPTMNNDEQPQPNTRAALVILMGVMIATMLGFGLISYAGSSSSILMMLIIGTVVLGITVMVGFAAQARYRAQAAATDEKPKRFAPGQDMYTLIDRMLDDLDADEMAYLRRRLEEQDQQVDDDLMQSMGELLDKRAALRGQG